MSGKDPCAGKVRFGSWDAAQMALVNAKIARALRPTTRRCERRAYWCGACRSFHLTSRPARRADGCSPGGVP